MTDTCSCPPGDCHGGHTIDIGPVTVGGPTPITTEQLEKLAAMPYQPGRGTTARLAAEVLALRARITELEDDGIDNDFGIQGMSIEPGASTLTTQPTTERARRLVLAMSLACGRMLDDDEAPNYVEFEVSPAGSTGQAAYVVHVRRAEGPSPHTLRREAEARAEKAEARLAELEAAQPEPIGYTAALRGTDGKLTEVFGGTDLTQKFAEQRVGYWRHGFPETDAVLVELREVTR